MLLALSSCEDDEVRNNNPNLPNIPFQAEINMTLPQFSALKFVGNSAELPGFGVSGVIVYNINGTTYSALDLSDPNHPPSSCSRMQVNGITATCPCPTDENSYTIIDGQPLTGDGEFGMRAYRVDVVGDVLIISN
jgi:hypothetical protein